MMIKLIFSNTKLCFPQRRQNRLMFCGFFSLKEFCLHCCCYKKIYYSKARLKYTTCVFLGMFRRWTVRDIFSAKTETATCGCAGGGGRTLLTLPTFRQVMMRWVWDVYSTTRPPISFSQTLLWFARDVVVVVVVVVVDDIMA